MGMECIHGEPKGPEWCAYCLYAAKKKLEAAARAKPVWIDTAVCFIFGRVLDGYTVTADDVVEAVGLPAGEVATDKNNALGAVFNHMSYYGGIVAVGEVRSTRASNCGRKITVWARNPAVSYTHLRAHET